MAIPKTSSLTPQDPVTLGLCSQIDLDAEVQKAARRVDRDRKDGGKGQDKAGTLAPTAETTAPSGNTATILAPKEAAVAPEETPEQEHARVLAKLKGMPSAKEDHTAEE